MKRTQVTLYIIIGLFVMLAIILFLGVNNKFFFKDQGTLFRDSLKRDILKISVDSCFTNLYYDGLNIFGLENKEEIKSHILTKIDECLNVDEIVLSYPGLSFDKNSKNIQIEINEQSIKLTLFYNIKYEANNIKFEFSRFDYTFPRTNFLRIETDNDGVVLREYNLESSDSSFILSIPENTRITDENNNPVVNPVISVYTNENDYREGVVGNFVYELKPDRINFNKPVKISVDVENLPRKITNDLNLAYKNRFWIALPSYYDGYTNTLNAETYHFSEFAINNEANVLYSYGLGWLFHDALDLDSNQKCENIKWEINEFGNILLPVNFYGERLKAKGFTSEEELKDFQNDIEVIKGPKEEDIERRKGYESYQKVGMNYELDEPKLNIVLNQEGSQNPDSIASINVVVIGGDLKNINGNILTLSSSQENKKIYSLDLEEGVLSPGEIFNFNYQIDKDKNQENGCLKSALTFSLRGKILPCSIRNRFNYLGEDSLQNNNPGQEYVLLSNLINYLSNEAEKYDLSFDYFNLPIDQIKNYKGLPEELYGLADIYSDAENIKCCGDEQYYDSSLVSKNNPSGCVSYDNLPNCNNEKYPCKCDKFVLQSSNFICNDNYPSIVQCPECSEEQYGENNCEAIINLPCLCGNSNEVITTDDKVCVSIED